MRMGEVLFGLSRWAIGAVCGGVLILSGCDEDIRQTILGGVENATITIVSALLSALFGAVTGQGDSSAVTVQAVFEHLQSWLV